jgi:hypothetical protein
VFTVSRFASFYLAKLVQRQTEATRGLPVRKVSIAMIACRDAVFALASAEARSSGSRLLILAELAAGLGMEDEATILVQRAYDVFDMLLNKNADVLVD